jgi:hypothetical protein
MGANYLPIKFSGIYGFLRSGDENTNTIEEPELHCPTGTTRLKRTVDKGFQHGPLLPEEATAKAGSH